MATILSYRMWKLAILGETQYFKQGVWQEKLFICLFIFCLFVVVFFLAEFQTVHRSVESAIVWRISGSGFV